MVTTTMASDNNRKRKGITSIGTYRYRYHVRGLCQAVIFIAVVGGFCVFNAVKDNELQLESQGVRGESTIAELENRIGSGNGKNDDRMENGNGDIDQIFHYSLAQRRMQGNDTSENIFNETNANTTGNTTVNETSGATLEPESSCAAKADPAWLIVFHFIGVLYMFLALAIVCDEFFVPALEEMSSNRRMNLSMDVAGATLMAAGGSAPELFTSLFGTFQGSEVGFGTIVGSAVFNVLFVIAMCALLAKEVLDLTWWPLFRDSFYYAIGLIVLAVFVGIASPGVIELYESIILFLMYMIYVAIMWKNADLYKWLTGKELEYPDEDEDDDEKEDAPQETTNSDGDPEGPQKKQRNGSISSVNSNGSGRANESVSGGTYFRWQGTFRAGILKLLRSPESWVETAGNGIVARIYGDAEYVFRQIDTNRDGSIDKQELKHLFELLECEVTAGELDDVFDALDANKDGTICEEEFNKWYIQSEERIRSQVKHVFDEIDVDKSNTIDRTELKLLLETLDSQVTDKDVTDAINEMYRTGSRDEITFEEFSEWYQHSILFERQKKQVEEETMGVWENVIPPWGGGCLDWIKYIIVVPLVLALTLTIPDVRRPGMSKWCYAAFILSIVWIGLFAYFMVDWSGTIGATIGIPDVIMGLTILAAGTSVPDMLSSVIVARRGCGDMAVSSSIGSNIFDILVGLPVPWFLYIVWPSTPSFIGINSGSLWVSILILLAMLVFVIASVHCQGWKLTKMLAALMLVFYFAFLAQAIVRELPFEVCN